MLVSFLVAVIKIPEKKLFQEGFGVGAHNLRRGTVYHSMKSLMVKAAGIMAQEHWGKLVTLHLKSESRERNAGAKLTFSVRTPSYTVRVLSPRNGPQQHPGWVSSPVMVNPYSQLYWILKHHRNTCCCVCEGLSKLE